MKVEELTTNGKAEGFLRQCRTTARRLDAAYGGQGNNVDEYFHRLSHARNARFETLKIAREARREQRRRALELSFDELTSPVAPSDIPVQRLPKELTLSPEAVAVRMDLKDAILRNADCWSETEVSVMLLYLRGYSPLAIFRTLGLSRSDGYRKFNACLDDVRDYLERNGGL